MSTQLFHLALCNTRMAREAPLHRHVWQPRCVTQHVGADHHAVHAATTHVVFFGESLLIYLCKYLRTVTTRSHMRIFACFRYLLLEDGDTGDVLMPLIYMKPVFEANYSRKLSSLRHRLVVIPSDQELSCARPSTYLYWQWAFESPLNVKLLVRQELGEENTPQASLSKPVRCSSSLLGDAMRG